MIIGLNVATIEMCAIEEQLRIASECGYEVIELRIESIEAYLKNHTLADLRRLIAGSGVRPLSINAIPNSTLRPGDQREVMNEVRKFAELAAAIDCPWIVATPGEKLPGAGWDETVTRSAASIAAFARLAWTHRVGVAFEFRGFTDMSVQTLSEALAVVQEANCANTGVTLDTAHFYSGGSSLADITRMKAHQLAVLHINDLVDKPREEIGDYDRIMPGEGVIPLNEICAELGRIGYDGPASVEIFNHSYNRLPPLAVARTAYEKALPYMRPSAASGRARTFETEGAL